MAFDVRQFIFERGRVTTGQLAESMGYSLRACEVFLHDLEEAGIVRPVKDREVWELTPELKAYYEAKQRRLGTKSA
jgi:hypothetical protein